MSDESEQWPARPEARLATDMNDAGVDAALLTRIALNCRECGFADSAPKWLLEALAKCMAGKAALSTLVGVGFLCPKCDVGLLVEARRLERDDMT